MSPHPRRPAARGWWLTRATADTPTTTRRPVPRTLPPSARNCRAPRADAAHQAARRACQPAPGRVPRGRPPPHQRLKPPWRTRSRPPSPPNRPRRKTATPRPPRPPPPAASYRSHPDQSTSPPGHPRPGRLPPHAHAHGRRTPRLQQAACCASPSTPPCPHRTSTTAHTPVHSRGGANRRTTPRKPHEPLSLSPEAVA